MKKCPFCAEEIQDEAVKCKHCGSDLATRPVPPGQPMEVALTSQKLKANSVIFGAMIPLGVVLLILGVVHIAFAYLSIPVLSAGLIGYAWTRIQV